jgi:putative tryptophan/tyrosine transport system substrate-binding protein
MRRRDFIKVIAASAIVWPLAARAQQSERVRRLAAFRQELERLGWSDGRNVHIDYRFLAGRRDQYLPLAKELIALQPDVILGQSTQVVDTLQKETRTIPIVFVNVSDPLGSGFIASLARPGGNLTGALLYETGIMASGWRCSRRSHRT